LKIQAKKKKKNPKHPDEKKGGGGAGNGGRFGREENLYDENLHGGGPLGKEESKKKRKGK